MRTFHSVSVPSLLCLATAACAGAPPSAAPANGVAAPVERFLAFYFHEYGRGLPGRSQLPVLASFVTPRLLDLFEAAMKAEECYAKENNYQVPPLVEGDLFSSLFEGGTSATYRLIAVAGDTATFEIEWTNDSPVGVSPFVWQDQVFAVKTTDGWLIADFAHDGTWDFMKDGNVSQILEAVARECTA